MNVNWLTDEGPNILYPRLVTGGKALVTQSNLSSVLSRQELENTCLHPSTNSWDWWTSAPPDPASSPAPSVAGNAVVVLAHSLVVFPGACSLAANVLTVQDYESLAAGTIARGCSA